MSTLIPFIRLPWETRFVDRFPGDPEKRNFTRPVLNALYSEALPTPVLSPRLIGWSEGLAREFGISRPGASHTTEDRESLEALSGNRVPVSARPYSARYGGHQFGHWAGQLGDGRAITLGEAKDRNGRRWEFQLKGAGPTPYSRRADGRAVLRSSIREFLCSEAMHALRVPTTRALSLVLTGDEVVRDMFYDGNPKAEPGAIVCRVSPSFLRFGNFEILASQGEEENLRSLADYLIEDHYPEIALSDPDRYAKLLDEIARRTARTIAQWMRVGFVHGVMNTDNLSALGLTIDYGPYGWLEPFDPDWTPNTTDAGTRRYRFGNQPGIAQWNLARLCEAFYPLIGDEARLQETLKTYKDTFEHDYEAILARKLGLEALVPELAESLFSLLGDSVADYTLLFRALSNWDPQSGSALVPRITPIFYQAADQKLIARWSRWEEEYGAVVRKEGRGFSERSKVMKSENPKYVLRNYLAQNAITAAENGDLSVLERLQKVLSSPYGDQEDAEDLTQLRPKWAENTPGCSSLSCSS